MSGSDSHWNDPPSYDVTEVESLIAATGFKGVDPRDDTRVPAQERFYKKLVAAGFASTSGVEGPEFTLRVGDLPIRQGERTLHFSITPEAWDSAGTKSRFKFIEAAHYLAQDWLEAHGGDAPTRLEIRTPAGRDAVGLPRVLYSARIAREVD